MEFHSMQISDHRYLEKVFKNLRSKLNLAEEAPVIGIGALKTNVLLWDCLCRRRWMPPFILDQITLNIWKYTGTQISRNSRIYSISRRDWYWAIKPKFWMCHRLWLDSSLMDKIFTDARPSDRVDESKSARLLRFRTCAWGTCQSFQKRIKDGKIKLKNFDSPILTKNYLELMENRLSSCGIFSQDLLLWRSSRKSKKTWRMENIELEKFEDRITVTSMFQWLWLDKERKFRTMRFHLPKKSRTTRRDSREGTGHSSAQETKRSGTELWITHLKENVIHRLTDGQCVMAAVSPPRRFAAWRVEAFFICGAFMLWPLQVAIYICKRQIPNDHVPQKRGNQPNSVQPSIRHCDLLPSHRYMARKKSIHIDTGWNYKCDPTSWWLPLAPTLEQVCTYCIQLFWLKASTHLLTPDMIWSFLAISSSVRSITFNAVALNFRDFRRNCKRSHSAGNAVHCVLVHQTIQVSE